MGLYARDRTLICPVQGMHPLPTPKPPEAGAAVSKANCLQMG